MPIRTGLVLRGYRPLAESLAPLSSELACCFWVIDFQGSPWVDTWVHEKANEINLVRQNWEVPAFENTSTFGLRPGSLPRLATVMLVDEWTYYFAIDQSEAEARVRAEILALHIGDLAESFLRQLDTLADLFICHGDGWWEFYCGREQWNHQLRAAWPDIHERPLYHAGNPL